MATMIITPIFPMTTSQLSLLQTGWLIPLAYLLAWGISHRLQSLPALWQLATGTSLLVMAMALATLLAGEWHAVPSSTVLPLASKLGVLLVSTLAWAVLRFSRHYLAGEARQPVYIRAMLQTLGCVLAVIVSQHLAIMVAAWAASSLGLHRLLTFYPERQAAQLVAHKKAITSRVAELCLFAALVLIYLHSHTLWLDELTALTEGSEPSTEMETAVVLIAVAVMLKSAQLPFHGWLIQVMEAPTPVSALLHAGVVNLGGLVLIKLSTLMQLSPVANGLLTIVGAITALLAGLVMMTRISIKVRLAWSTCAQMGFMLLECGLGLYELALLHVITHSFYKAYAFLSAGDTVYQTRSADYWAGIGQSAPSLLARLLSLPVATVLVWLSYKLGQLWLPGLQVSWVIIAIVSLGLATLLWAQTSTFGTGLLRLMGISQLYWLGHTVMGVALPTSHTLNTPLALIGLGCLAMLFLLQTWVYTLPGSQLATRLYPWAYNGFYLDDNISAVMLRLWPLPHRQGYRLPQSAPRTAPTTLPLP